MNKEDFISIFELTLVSANLEVAALTLLDNDTVRITFRNGYTKDVCIECDSYAAIALDVTRKAM